MTGDARRRRSRGSWTIVLAASSVAVGVVAVVLLVARPDPSTATAPDGANLFQAKGCASCHDGPGVHAAIGGAPSLAVAASWAGERVEGLTAAEYLSQSMREPAAFFSPMASPGFAMPQLELADAEVDALVGFLLAADAARQG